MAAKSPRIRQWLVTTALVAGVGVGTAGIASAATSSTTTPTASSTTAPSTSAPTGTMPDPATMAHGPNETLLTGTELASATAAATAAQPGATIIRAETNSSGTSTYEVHLKKTDGSYVTVELDSSFKVTNTDQGFGAGPAGSQPPAQAPSSTSTN